eukprot:1178849-Prorocentrum_minimum.AAC.3
MLDLPVSVTGAAHLSNDLGVCKRAFIDTPFEEQADCGSFDWGSGSMCHPDVVKVSFAPTPTEDVPQSDLDSPSQSSWDPSPSSPPPNPTAPTATSERATAERATLSQSRWLQNVKMLTSWANLEMPDAVYLQCEQEVTQCANAIRDILKAATVPGEFTVFRKAKGSNSRTPRSITKNKTLRGTKRNAAAPEFVEGKERGRKKNKNKTALIPWERLKKLGVPRTLRA